MGYTPKAEIVKTVEKKTENYFYGNLFMWPIFGFGQFYLSSKVIGKIRIRTFMTRMCVAAKKSHKANAIPFFGLSMLIFRASLVTFIETREFPAVRKLAEPPYPVIGILSCTFTIHRWPESCFSSPLPTNEQRQLRTVPIQYPYMYTCRAH